MKLPKYRHFKARNKGFVEFKGKRTYFPGKYGDPESRRAYDLFLSENCDWQTASKTALTLGDVCTTYLLFAISYYQSSPQAYHQCHKMVDYLIGQKPNGCDFAWLPVEQFGPFKLKEFRDFLLQPTTRTINNTTQVVEDTRCRNTINKYVRRVQKMFEWAVSEEIVQPSLSHALNTVRPLEKNRSSAIDHPKRAAVPVDRIFLTMNYLPWHVAEMLYLQFLLGVRSESLCEAKPEQFRVDGDLLIWAPRHKQEHKEQELFVPLGPVAQVIIRPYLRRDPDAYCFNPQEYLNGSNRRYKDHYTTGTYRNAVQRAQKRAGLTKENGLRWTPHQMRNTRGQMIREQFGAEAAQSILGHASLAATQIYTERRLELAKAIAQKVG